MQKVSRGGKGKTLYIQLSVYRCGTADPKKNLTISCPTPGTCFRATLSDYGLKRFRELLLRFYGQQVLQGCDHPEKLKSTPGECSPEQIGECHGEIAQHPCHEKG